MKNRKLFSKTYSSICQIIEEEYLWGKNYFTIFIKELNKIVKVPEEDLIDPVYENTYEKEALHIKYLASAAKVAQILDNDIENDSNVLLAPFEANIIPLPHQLQTLRKAISGKKIRFLLADEVGLGKTIEAGLILRELKLRGLVKRILVVAPKGLATQWEAEMLNHFNEQFQFVSGDNVSSLKDLIPGLSNKLSDSNENELPSVWSLFDQVIVTTDSVKPIENRKGWPAEKIADYNQIRFEELINANWDLIIIDEAHRLGGGSEQIARFKLGKGLAESAPYLLLLTATPHQGKADQFQRLMSLLDNESFPDTTYVTRERVAPFVLRTEKRKAIDFDGKALFKPRKTELVAIKNKARHAIHVELYNSVTDYVRKSYNQAVRDKKTYVGFLMILMQRLVVSSTQAIRETLEKRLTVLNESEDYTLPDLPITPNGRFFIENWQEMDGQELWDVLSQMRSAAIANEKAEVKTLLELARKAEAGNPDAKAEALLEWIYKLQTEENDTDLKLLVFTEFVATQKMLANFLKNRGFTITTLNGSMDMAERLKVQNEFKNSARILISTDAGGEGLNLQFAHIVINYDMPWNPMRLEQRIGRVDRIGQNKVVRAINFAIEDSVEYRVREVLAEKLQIIFEEFGTDKTGDVLDSTQAGELFEDVFTSSILNPDKLEHYIDYTVDRIRGEFNQLQENSSIFSVDSEVERSFAEKIRSHPLPHWLEQMTTAYIQLNGGTAEKKRSWWELIWPDGHKEENKSVFFFEDARRLTDAALVNLENERVRKIAQRIPARLDSMPIPEVSLPNLPSDLAGFWGLFELSLHSLVESLNTNLKDSFNKDKLFQIAQPKKVYFSIFQSADGIVYLPAAKHIWDLLQSESPNISGFLSEQATKEAEQSIFQAACQNGTNFFETLKHRHNLALDAEIERANISFEYKLNAIEKIGLPEVKQYRLKRIENERKIWEKQLNLARKVVPDLKTILLLKILQEK